MNKIWWLVMGVVVAIVGAGWLGWRMSQMGQSSRSINVAGIPEQTAEGATKQGQPLTAEAITFDNQIEDGYGAELTEDKAQALAEALNSLGWVNGIVYGYVEIEGTAYSSRLHIILTGESWEEMSRVAKTPQGELVLGYRMEANADTATLTVFASEYARTNPLMVSNYILEQLYRAITHPEPRGQYPAPGGVPALEQFLQDFNSQHSEWLGL